MSDFKRVSPEEAKALLDGGWTYLDVRTEAEFAAGRPPGSYNVPLLHAAPSGMAPNPDFAGVLQARFPKDAKLVVGCKSGARSMKAAALLRDLGYTSFVELRTGFDGARDAFGRLDPGWGRAGLPIETGTNDDRSYPASYAKLER